jgi:glutamate dehydrogenase (NADP+)
VYFAEQMLKTREDDFQGKTVLVSGSGNVAQFACKKTYQYGGKVTTMSDSSGFVHDPDGIDLEKLAFIMELKNERYGRISEYAENFPGVKYYEGQKPWGVKCDIAMPCATQNEINLSDAKELLKNGCFCLSEGANMPTESDAINYFIEKRILYGPGKAANAGGVAVSGLEMVQNSLHTSWLREEVKEKLYRIMIEIHSTCEKYGKEQDGYTNYMKGASIGGFIKVADAMIAQGVV